MTTLEKYKQYIAQINSLVHVISLLYWDMTTNAPKKGKPAVGKIINKYATDEFELETSDELFEMLKELEKPEIFDTLDEAWKFDVKKRLKVMESDRRVPVEFYAKYMEAQTNAQIVWEEAKQSLDWSKFEPVLAELVDYSKRLYQYKYPDKNVYDAMIDNYAEGMTCETIDRVFDELKTELIPLVKQILVADQPDDSKFFKFVPKYQQDELCKFLLKYQGFSFERGTLGETEHPYTTFMNYDDTRIANHFHEDCFVSAVFSAIHEGGHAIFQQQADEKYAGTAGCDCTNMDLHESQSRIYENVLGRNINFWKPIWDQCIEIAPALSDISLEEFYKEINHVRASYIRTEADEVTYCFHVILRYEIEREIFKNNLPVSEIPKLWNEKMKEYLGIEPTNDAEGALQDSHWSGGSFGYFPSYLLGSIYDGMFIDAIEEKLGNIDEILAEGRILDITEWLRVNIHSFGGTRKPAEVLMAVCGKEVTAEPLVRYFKKKYAEVYNL